MFYSLGFYSASVDDTGEFLFYSLNSYSTTSTVLGSIFVGVGECTVLSSNLSTLAAKVYTIQMKLILGVL